MGIKRTQYIIPVIFVTIFVALFALVVMQKLENNAKIDRKKLTDIVNKNDCSKGLQKVSHMKATLDNTADSIALLSYRSTCLLQLKQYEKAVPSLKELRTYYLKTGNKAAIANIDSNITYAKYELAHPDQQSKNSTPPDPELQRGVEKLKAL